MYRLMDSAPDTPIELPTTPKEQSGHNGGVLDTLLKPARSALGVTAGVADTLWKEASASLANPMHLLDLTVGAIAAAEALGGALLMPADTATLFKGELGVRKRVAWSWHVPLDDVKRIGRATDAKVNDVLLAVVTGALRAYLIARGTDVEGLEVRAVVPVDLRPPARAHDLGNEFGLAFLALPLGLDDSLKRVAEIRHRMNEIKRSPQPQVFFGLLTIFGMTPAQVEEPVVRLFGSKATTVITNVAGPCASLYMAGSRITDMMFWVPQSGRLGMGISILSYNGSVTLGVITDAGHVPDPEAITARFEEEFRHMLAAAQQS
jgi:WS/DGAT/MGAT family acyltransferase